MYLWFKLERKVSCGTFSTVPRVIFDKKVLSMERAISICNQGDCIRVFIVMIIESSDIVKKYIVFGRGCKIR